MAYLSKYLWSFLLFLSLAAASCFCLWPGLRRRPMVLFVRTDNFSQHMTLHEHFMNAIRYRDDLIGLSAQTFIVPSFLLCQPYAADKLSCTSICDAVLDIPADCIVTVGRMITQVMVGQAKKRDVHTPIVFVGADKPVELGLVESLDYPGGDATGLFTTAADEPLCGILLHAAYPEVRSVLLPYYVTGDAYNAVANRAQAIKKYLKSKNVSVTIAEIDTIPDALKRVEGLLPGHDMLMTLEDDGPINESQMAGCARLAQRYNIGFFSGIKQAISEGALFTYALELRYSVEAALELVKKIVCEGAYPGDIPVVRLGSSREFIINQKRADELGIHIDIDELQQKTEADPVLACVRDRVRVV